MMDSARFSEILKSAGKLILSYSGKRDIAFSYKQSVKDIVTEADRKAEQLLIEKLREIDDIAFLSEESHADYLLSKEPCWIVDPLDGTTNFYAGLSIYAVSVAHFDGEQVDYAACYAPETDELYTAMRGAGALKNGKPIHVNTQDEPLQAVIATGFADITQDLEHNTLAVFNEMIFKTRAIRRLGSAVMDILYTAEGIFSFFYEAGLSPWDVAAASLIAEEAGAIVSDFSGGNQFMSDRTIIVSNKELYKFAKSIINKQYNTGR